MALDLREARRPAASGAAGESARPSEPVSVQAGPRRMADDKRVATPALSVPSAKTTLTAKDRMFFTERLGLLLETGIPLHQSLESIATQAGKPELGGLTTGLYESVTGGATFARALADYPEFFPPTYRHLIAAAEAGGFLPVALDRLRDMEERREELRGTLNSAMSYPAILAFFSFAVVVFVLVVVFPKFEEIFATIHDQLPVTTRWLMATSDLLRRAWLPILIAGAAGFHLLREWARKPAGRRLIDHALFAMPRIRDVAVQLNVVQMLRVMGLSLGNGVATVDALHAARDSVSSESFRQLIDDAEQGVQEGRGLADGFKRSPLVPDLVKQMLATGEETGSLPAVMNRLADFYEREWRRDIEIVAKVAEPAMLLIMGCVVGLIVSSLILPIFKLSRAVH